MKSAPSPFGSCKVLALYKQVVVLYEIYAYLIVAEAVNHRNEESLKRGGKTVEIILVCILLCSNQHKSTIWRGTFTTAIVSQGSMKNNYCHSWSVLHYPTIPLEMHFSS